MSDDIFKFIDQESWDNNRDLRAQAIYNEGKRNVLTSPAPAGQKFSPGTIVKIAEDLGPSMSHFVSGKEAKVLYTYGHAYGGSDMQQYALLVRVSKCKWREIAWYHESQLTSLEELNDPK